MLLQLNGCCRCLIWRFFGFCSCVSSFPFLLRLRMPAEGPGLTATVRSERGMLFKRRRKKPHAPPLNELQPGPSPIKKFQDIVELCGLQLKKVCYYDFHPYAGPGLPWPMVVDHVHGGLDWSKATRLFCCAAHLKAWLETDHATTGHMFTVVEAYCRVELGFALGPPAAMTRKRLDLFYCGPDAVTVEGFRSYGDYYWLSAGGEGACWRVGDLALPDLHLIFFEPKPEHITAVCYHEGHGFDGDGISWPLPPQAASVRFCSVACLLFWILNDREQSPFLALELLRPFVLHTFGWTELPPPAPDRVALTHFSHNGMDIDRFRSLGDYFRRSRSLTTTAFDSRFAWSGPSPFVVPSVVARSRGALVAVVKQPLVQVSGMALTTRAQAQKEAARAEAAQRQFSAADEPAVIFKRFVSNVRRQRVEDIDITQGGAAKIDDPMQVAGPMQTFRGNGVTIRRCPTLPRSLMQVGVVCRVLFRVLCFLCFWCVRFCRDAFMYEYLIHGRREKLPLPNISLLFS